MVGSLVVLHCNNKQTGILGDIKFYIYFATIFLQKSD